MAALSIILYIPQTWICLVDQVDLIYSLNSWWEGFGSSSLATLPLGFNCGLISTSACGLSTGVCPWGFPGGLGFSPVRSRCGGSTDTWVSGFWGVGGLGSRKYSALEGYGNQCWPICSSILAWRTPWQRSLAGHSQDHKAWDVTEATLQVQWCKTIF